MQCWNREYSSRRPGCNISESVCERGACSLLHCTRYQHRQHTSAIHLHWTRSIPLLCWILVVQWWRLLEYILNSSYLLMSLNGKSETAVMSITGTARRLSVSTLALALLSIPGESMELRVANDGLSLKEMLTCKWDLFLIQVVCGNEFVSISVVLCFVSKRCIHTDSDLNSLNGSNYSIIV